MLIRRDNGRGEPHFSELAVTVTRGQTSNIPWPHKRSTARKRAGKGYALQGRYNLTRHPFLTRWLNHCRYKCHTAAGRVVDDTVSSDFQCQSFGVFCGGACGHDSVCLSETENTLKAKAIDQWAERRLMAVDTRRGPNCTRRRRRSNSPCDRSHHAGGIANTIMYIITQHSTTPLPFMRGLLL